MKNEKPDWLKDDYRCPFDSSFLWDGENYETVELAFLASKTKDRLVRKQLSSQKTYHGSKSSSAIAISNAKDFGESIDPWVEREGTDEEMRWENQKDLIYKDIIFHRFDSHPKLSLMLMNCDSETEKILSPEQLEARTRLESKRKQVEISHFNNKIWKLKEQLQEAEDERNLREEILNCEKKLASNPVLNMNMTLGIYAANKVNENYEGRTKITLSSTRPAEHEDVHRIVTISLEMLNKRYKEVKDDS